jgi:putative transposase
MYVLAIIEHASQRVRILGVTTHPDNRRVTQMARNLIMEVGEYAEAVTFLIRDRDTKFTAAFDRMFADAGLKILRRRLGVGHDHLSAGGVLAGEDEQGA